jgi:hypothetical protein
MFGQHDDNQQQDYNNVFGQSNDDNGSNDTPAPAPGAPIGPISDDVHPVNVSTPAPEPVQDLSTTEIADHIAATGSTDDLLGIKQDALQELTPLVGHLEQTAEEKFRTTMMMIQATDDHSLIKQAYESAKQITDEKTRAQALLDVVNEINYFTQQHN